MDNEGNEPHGSRTQSGRGKVSKVRWINPESRQKTFVSGTYERTNNEISLWSIPSVPQDGESFKCDCRLTVGHDVNDLESCGSSSFAMALNNGDLSVIDADHGRLTIRHTMSSVHQSCANAISSYDNWIVSGGADGSILLHDLNAITQPTIVTSQMSSVRALSVLTPNLIVSSHLCGRIYVWDLRERSSVLPWLKPVLAYYPSNTPAAIMSVASHPADRHLISFGTEEGVVGFLDTRIAAECIAPVSLPFPIGCINEIKFHPNYPDNVYCVSSEGLLVHLDATKQSVLQHVDEREATRSSQWISRPSSFGNANVTVLMEGPLPVNSVDVCADGIIAGGDSHMLTFIDKEFFV